MNLLKHIFQFILTLLFMACGNTIKDSKDFMAYLANPGNGLLKEKTVAGISYKLNYLPCTYLAYNEAKMIKGLTESEKNKLVEKYKNSLTFLLEIGPSKDENFDITRVGVNNYQQFAERIENMAFNAQEWFYLTMGGDHLKPSIVRLENLNAQSNSRKFIVVFAQDINDAKINTKENLCFTYTDELFNTGTNKFLFKASDMKRLPIFKF